VLIFRFIFTLNYYSWLYLTNALFQGLLHISHKSLKLETLKTVEVDTECKPILHVIVCYQNKTGFDSVLQLIHNEDMTKFFIKLVSAGKWITMNKDHYRVKLTRKHPQYHYTNENKVCILKADTDTKCKTPHSICVDRSPSETKISARITVLRQHQALKQWTGLSPHPPPTLF